MVFISLEWGGRTSDVYLTENCGLLQKLLSQKLLSGDLVLACRGYNIEEATRFYCVEVQVPPSAKGKTIESSRSRCSSMVILSMHSCWKSNQGFICQKVHKFTFNLAY